jgi:hypothetical protein
MVVEFLVGKCCCHRSSTQQTQLWHASGLVRLAIKNQALFLVLYRCFFCQLGICFSISAVTEVQLQKNDARILGGQVQQLLKQILTNTVATCVKSCLTSHNKKSFVPGSIGKTS